MGEKIKILVVEDEQTLARIIADILLVQDFGVEIAYDGEEGLRKFNSFGPAVVVTDVMMPKLDGFSMAKKIREINSKTQILFLTARVETDDVVKGFNLGANDYLKKPFAIAEMVARVKALAERTSNAVEDNKIYHLGSFTFNTVEWTLVSGNNSETLSSREAQILQHLCKNIGNVVPAQTLLMDIWGNDDYYVARSLIVFITHLRNKLSPDPSVQIINVRGVGYKLICKEQINTGNNTKPKHNEI